LPTNQQQQQQQKQQQQLLFLQRIESAGLLLPKIVAHLGVLEISRASGGAVASVLHNGTRPGNHILVALLVYYCALRTSILRRACHCAVAPLRGGVGAGVCAWCA
jgi:uncharacterized membrane protein